MALARIMLISTVGSMLLAAPLSAAADVKGGGFASRDAASKACTGLSGACFACLAVQD